MLETICSSGDVALGGQARPFAVRPTGGDDVPRLAALHRAGPSYAGHVQDARDGGAVNAKRRCAAESHHASTTAFKIGLNVDTFPSVKGLESVDAANGKPRAAGRTLLLQF